MLEVAEVKARGAPCGPKCKSRYIMAILASIGMGLIYGLKVGLHVVIVAMVNQTAIRQTRESEDDTDGCGAGSEGAAKTTDHLMDGPFDWSPQVQGYLLSAYFIGYMVAELPGGIIAEKFSAKWVMFFAVTLNIICILFSPTLSTLHFGALMASRILQGVGGGVTFPACHVLLSHWAPPTERSLISAVVYAGTALGTVIFMLSSGYIAHKMDWEAVFYLEGGVSSIWLLFWIIFIADTPQKQPFITEEERTFIGQSLQEGAHKDAHPPMPWKAAFTSMPFLAILVAHTCSNWGWYMLLIELPQYMTHVLHFKLSENGGLSAMPFLVMWVFSLILGRTFDALIKKEKLSVTCARKIGTLCASFIPATCFIILCFVGCERMLSVALMTIAVTSIGGMFSGFLSNHIDIAPNHAGTLMAITNTVATIPGIAVPAVLGKLLQQDHSIRSWRIMFYITIGLYVIEMIFYTTFGSGEIQPWNNL